VKISATRDEALDRLQDFVGVSGRYSRDRNHVVPGHGNVSCLSAAIRHRLVTEWEVAAAPLARYAASTVEKFTQEVYWRSYWKGWLSLRPQVWSEYLEGVAEHPGAGKIRRGEGPVAVINGFARELTETGYLHNHARMWFAAYWVHVARLPWELGAKFFQDHLLDFDPAANTLSWRWVAGWQTPGKTYLPRRGNIEKYLHPDLLETGGLQGLENPVALMPEEVGKPAVTRVDLPENDLPDEGFVLWIHEEDLHPESSPMGGLKPSKIVVTSDVEGKSVLQKEWLGKALDDAAERAGKYFGVPVERAKSRAKGGGPYDSLVNWAGEKGVTKVVGLRPEVGPLHDLIPSIEAAGVALNLVVRPEDRYLRAFATAGFFGFWKKLQGRMAKGEFPLDGKLGGSGMLL
jgi:deoxyribodipyrimidine photo-lyase